MQGIFIKNEKNLSHNSIKSKLGDIINFSSDGNKIKDIENQVIFNGIIYNRNEVISNLSLPNSNDYDDAQLINLAYQKTGEECLSHFNGDFSFVIYQPLVNTLFCARDHVGAVPFYYFNNTDVFIFSDTLEYFQQFDFISRELNSKFLLDSLLHLGSNTNLTQYTSIHRLSPATYISLSDRQFSLNKYWDIKRSKTEILKNENEYYEKYRSLFTQAVISRLKTNKNVGSELSGGLDSSAVSCVAATKLQGKNKNVTTFSHILPKDILQQSHPIKDEQKYIKLVCEHAGIKNFVLNSSEESGIIHELEKDIKENNRIHQQRFAIFGQPFYKSARDKNINVMLSGFGGDNLLTAQAGYYQIDLFKNRRFGILLSELLHQKSGLYPKFRKLLTIGSFALNMKGIKKLQTKIKIQNSPLLSNPSTAKILKKYFYLINPKNPTSLADFTVIDLNPPYLTNRMETLYYFAKPYGITYRYPLLDKKLMEFYFSSPDHLKYKNGWGRHFFRQAMKDILPEEIQWRKDKSGATVPNSYTRTLKDIEEIETYFRKVQNHHNAIIDFQKLLDYVEETKQSLNDSNKKPKLLYVLNYFIILKFLEKNNINLNEFFNSKI